MSPTESHLEWLKQQMEGARNRMEKARQRFIEIRNEMNEADQAYSTWENAYRLALNEARGKAGHKAQVSLNTESKIETEKAEDSDRPTGTIPDIAEDVLREKGPLKTRELAELVNERRGSNSHVNTIFVGLNRHKGKRFTRKNGLWCLMSQANGNGKHG